MVKAPVRKKKSRATNKADVTFDSTSLIPRHASTPIIMGVLDNAIQLAVEPLLKETNIAQRALLQLIGQFSGDTARCTLTKMQFALSDIVEAIKDRDFVSYRRAHLDRSTSLSIARYFIRKMERFRNEEGNTDFSAEFIAYANHVDSTPSRLFSLYKIVKDYEQVATFIVEEIYKKYISKSWKEARRKAEFSGQNVDVTHVFPNLILGVQQGIDRCCVDRGNLTASIQNFQRVWALHKSYGATYGIAYDISQSSPLRLANAETHEQVNFAAPLDDIQESDYIVFDEPTYTSGAVLTGLAKIEDAPLALLVNDLIPPLTLEQKRLLRTGKE